MIKCHSCNKTPTAICDYKLDGRSKGWKCCVKLCKQCKDKNQHCPMHDHIDKTNPNRYTIITEDPQTTGPKARCKNNAVNSIKDKREGQVVTTDEISINEQRRLCSRCNKPPTTRCNRIDTINDVEFECNNELCYSCSTDYDGCGNHQQQNKTNDTSTSSTEKHEDKQDRNNENNNENKNEQSNRPNNEDREHMIYEYNVRRIKALANEWGIDVSKTPDTLIPNAFGTESKMTIAQWANNELTAGKWNKIKRNRGKL